MYIISFGVQVRQETDKEMLLSPWQRGTKVKEGQLTQSQQQICNRAQTPLPQHPPLVSVSTCQDETRNSSVVHTAKLSSQSRSH